MKDAKTRAALWHVSFDTTETIFPLGVLPADATEIVPPSIATHTRLLIEEQTIRTSRGIEVDTAKAREGEIWDGRAYRSEAAFRDKYLHCPKAPK